MKAQIVLKSDLDYPKLRFVNNSNGLLVVLFESISKGMVVYDEDKTSECYEIGHYSDNWEDADFKDYNGEIILRNN